MLKMNSNILETFNKFINYGLNLSLINENDIIYIQNSLMGIFKTDSIYVSFVRNDEVIKIDDILDNLIDYAINVGIITNYQYERDLFDTRLMDIFTPLPSIVIKEFFNRFQGNKKNATDYFYQLMIDVNYIRINRIKKNFSFHAESQYGDILITINLSKPEKDPRDIAKAKTVVSNKYPKCALCYENIGFYGTINQQARNNLRVIPLQLNCEQFYLQYSPYTYFTEHCIVFKKEHEDMKINRQTFKRLLDFVDQFPHYFIGSNADLPIVGGSILNHEHYQGGAFVFPALDQATSRHTMIVQDVQLKYLNWPLDCLQLVSNDKEKVISVADNILTRWRSYQNKAINIINSLEDLHNTITPIARFVNDKYVLTLILRNNYTTDEQPYGLYHPDETLHHIKKENIGLIEVLGLAILPGRLINELKVIDDVLKDIVSETAIETIAHHKVWYQELKMKKENNLPIDLQKEVGKKFVKVMEACQVFKYGSLQDVIQFIDSLE